MNNKTCFKNNSSERYYFNRVLPINNPFKENASKRKAE